MARLAGFWLWTVWPISSNTSLALAVGQKKMKAKARGWGLAMAAECLPTRMAWTLAPLFAACRTHSFYASHFPLKLFQIYFRILVELLTERSGGPSLEAWVFFCQTLISKIASWVKLFFSSSHKYISWMKLEKSSLLQLLPHFSLSTMYEVVGEAILPNIFSKNSSASSRKSLMKLFSKKIALLVKLSCAKQALISYHQKFAAQIEPAISCLVRLFSLKWSLVKLLLFRSWLLS